MFIGYIGADSIGSLIKRFAAKAEVEDGEISNQRKGEPSDMLAWSEGTVTDDEGNHGYDVIVGGELLQLLRSPHKHPLNPKRSNQQAPDATSFFPVGGMPTATGLKDFSKSQDAVALQQIKGVAAPMIDRGDIRQAIDNYVISGSCCRALVMVSSSIELTADCKIEAGGTVREIDV